MTQQDLPDSNYLLPYNEAEIRRLRLQHDLIQSYMGGLILAPINFEQKGLKILDSGTFDGFWLAEASKLVAEPILVGADISPTMFPPSSSGSTGDLSFHVQSVVEPWPETWKGTFDLVHQRLVLAGTTPEVGKNAVRSLVEHFAMAAKGLPDDSNIHTQDFEDVLRDIKVEVDTVGSLLRFNAVWGRRP